MSLHNLKIGESYTFEHRDPVTGELTGDLTTVTLLDICRGEAKFWVKKDRIPQVDLDIRRNEADHARTIRR